MYTRQLLTVSERESSWSSHYMLSSHKTIQSISNILGLPIPTVYKRQYYGGHLLNFACALFGQKSLKNSFTFVNYKGEWVKATKQILTAKFVGGVFPVFFPSSLPLVMNMTAKVFSFILFSSLTLVINIYIMAAKDFFSLAFH